LPPSVADSTRDLDASVGASEPHDFAVRACCGSSNGLRLKNFAVVGDELPLFRKRVGLNPREYRHRWNRRSRMADFPFIGVLWAYQRRMRVSAIAVARTRSADGL